MNIPLRCPYGISLSRAAAILVGGRYLMFNSSRNGEDDIFWRDAGITEEPRRQVLGAEEQP